EVWNVAGDFLRTEFGVAGADLEFIDVNGGEDVIFDDALADQDCILEVVAVPGHESAENVSAQRQFAPRGARTVGDDLALFNAITFVDQNFLVDAGGGV